MRTVIISLCAAVIGAGLVLACGDDSPGDADAAGECTCPPAEAPLAGRIEGFSQDVVIEAGQGNSLTLACPEGSILLTGGCTSGTGGLRAGPSGPPSATSNGWGCDLENPMSGPITATIVVKCLKPAAQ